MNSKTISTDFPYESKFIDIHGSKIHYIDEGQGDPILFLHGNPTSSYLWRNIIPYMTSHGRCIAIDLIGMGKSDKPDIDYRFNDHYRYVESFIEKLKLKNLTLVVHDWGSGLGFHYAMTHEDNIKGLAFMEAILHTMSWREFPSDQKIGFKLFRTPVIGWLMLSPMNMFLNKLMPEMIVRTLSREEKSNYGAPYKNIKDRKPIRQWPCEIPIDGKPKDVHDIITSYSQKLQASPLPKILFYAQPGAIINDVRLKWCQSNLKNLELVSIGEGRHYIQEDNPHLIGEKLADWYQSISKNV